MVYFKISDGQVTRKFRVNPGEITYDQLQERIATLFPKALEGSKDLHLKYRDSDGDLITISTNDEFQEALAELPEDHVWKLQIHDHRSSPSRPAPRMNVPSDFFFQPSQVPFGGFGGFGGFSDPGFGWGMRRPSFPWLGGNPWSNLEREFDKMLEEHSETLNALHNTGGSEGGAEAKPAAGQEGENVVQRQSSGAADTPDGKIQIKNIGSWEPKEFDGPFGKGRIIGPVGYYVSWSSGPEAEGRGEKTEEKESEEKNSTPEASSAKESTEGTET